MKATIVLKARVNGHVVEIPSTDLVSVSVGDVLMTPATFLQALQVGALALQPGGADALYRKLLYELTARVLENGTIFEGLATALQLPWPYLHQDLRAAAVRDGFDPKELFGWRDAAPPDHELFADEPPPAA